MPRNFGEGERGREHEQQLGETKHQPCTQPDPRIPAHWDEALGYLLYRDRTTALTQSQQRCPDKQYCYRQKRYAEDTRTIRLTSRSKKKYQSREKCASNARTSRDAAMEHEYGLTAANAPAVKWNAIERSHRAHTHAECVCVDGYSNTMD